MASSIDLATWPTAREDASEAKWQKMVKRWMADGVYSGASDTSLLAVFADSTGMHVKVPTGEALVHGFHCEVTTTETLSVSAANASHARLDYVALRLDMESPATISLVVITGTPSSSPVLPALTNTLTVIDVPLASIEVDALVSTIAANKVTLLRQWAGTGPSAWTAWSTVMSLTAGATITIPAQTPQRSVYRLVGSVCEFNIAYLVGLGGTPGGGLLFTLPFPARYAAIPFRGDAHNLIARSYVSIIAGASYAELRSIEGTDNAWPVDSIQRGVNVSGSYEIAQ